MNVLTISFSVVILNCLFFKSIFGSESLDESSVKIIKNNFIEAIRNKQTDVIGNLINENEFLTSKFDSDIFEELINCFDLNTEDDPEFVASACWTAFESLKPTFGKINPEELEGATSLIMAVRKNQIFLVKELLKLDNVKDTINSVDIFGRSALIYACKAGSFFAVKIILDISADAINLRDMKLKTALHYACEMRPKTSPLEGQNIMTSIKSGQLDLQKIFEYFQVSDADINNKKEIVEFLLSRGAEVIALPAYKLTSDDYLVELLLQARGGSVQVTETLNYKIKKMFIVASMIKFIHFSGLFEMLKNISVQNIHAIYTKSPLIQINNLFYHLQNLILPGVDLNLNISVDVYGSIHDFSFNLFFLAVVAYVIYTWKDNLKKLQICSI